MILRTALGSFSFYHCLFPCESLATEGCASASHVLVLGVLPVHRIVANTVFASPLSATMSDWRRARSGLSGRRTFCLYLLCSLQKKCVVADDESPRLTFLVFSPGLLSLIVLCISISTLWTIIYCFCRESFYFVESDQ